jgi:hypothetical protein
MMELPAGAEAVTPRLELDPVATPMMFEQVFLSGKTSQRPSPWLLEPPLQCLSACLFGLSVLVVLEGRLSSVSPMGSA